MAKTGLLGKLAITAGAAGSNIEVYRVPTGHAATVTINIVQRVPTTAVVDVGLVEPGGIAISQDDFIVVDAHVNYREAFERKGIVLGSQEAVFVGALSAGPTVVIWGFEEVD